MPRRPPDIEFCPLLREYLPKYKDGLRPIHIQLWTKTERERVHDKLIERGLIRFDGEQWVLTERGRDAQVARNMG